MGEARRTNFLFFQCIKNSMKNAGDLGTPSKRSCVFLPPRSKRNVFIHNSNPPGLLILPYRRRIVRRRSCDYRRTKVCCPDVRFLSRPADRWCDIVMPSSSSPYTNIIMWCFIRSLYAVDPTRPDRSSFTKSPEGRSGACLLQ